mmetsp:Transcript_107485/g.302500  ORF Transcript_107485/g.302500 Transcript_107485/m.302500 type:complete len:285 (-) Transcript_107485:189-1043(-)
MGDLAGVRDQSGGLRGDVLDALARWAPCLRARLLVHLRRVGHAPDGVQLVPSRVAEGACGRGRNGGRCPRARAALRPSAVPGAGGRVHGQARPEDAAQHHRHRFAVTRKCRGVAAPHSIEQSDLDAPASSPDLQSPSRVVPLPRLEFGLFARYARHVHADFLQEPGGPRRQRRLDPRRRRKHLRRLHFGGVEDQQSARLLRLPGVLRIHSVPKRRGCGRHVFDRRRLRPLLARKGGSGKGPPLVRPEGAVLGWRLAHPGRLPDRIIDEVPGLRLSRADGARRST